MKMKEVLLQTGLTDRAVRLYIENGLLTPNNEKSYSGRNSYDFTEEDVAVLQQIALLRKAEFSPEQIKLLQQGGEDPVCVGASGTSGAGHHRSNLQRNRKGSVQ